MTAAVVICVSNQVDSALSSDKNIFIRLVYQIDSISYYHNLPYTANITNQALIQ